jgi:hypothetical protein
VVLCLSPGSLIRTPGRRFFMPGMGSGGPVDPDGAHEVLFHVTSGVDLARSHKLAKRMGFELIGGSYGKNNT